MFKKTLVAVAAMSVFGTSMASSVDDRRNWEYMFNTTPWVIGFDYNQRCESLGSVVHQIATLRDHGMFPNDIFHALYIYKSDETWGHGLELLIDAAFEAHNQDPVSLARRTELLCKGAE